MLFRKTPDEMDDQELEAAKFAVQALMDHALTKRDNPKYKKKFKNQPPPTVNPALLELKNKIELEIFKRRKENINV